MTAQEFSNGVRDIRRACDLADSPRSDVLTLWYSYLKGIESKEWKSIVSRMIRTMSDGFPRNFVATVLSYVEPKQAPILIVDEGQYDDESARMFFETLHQVGKFGFAKEE